MADVVWLASYPKSGSTWTRALLAAYLSEGEVDLNNLSGGVRGAGLRTLSDLLGVEKTLFRPDELAALKPTAARWLAREASSWQRPVVEKIHSANVEAPSGERVFPADAGRALYIVRNPLDVAASFAPFFGVSVDAAIDRMADDGFVLAPIYHRFVPFLPEPLLSWSSHVASWLDAPGQATYVLRYEDLHRDTSQALEGALRFLGVVPDAARVEAAVEAARFDRLREQEAAAGFNEHATMATTPFFRRGRAGGWRDELTPEQARRVVSDHGPTMRRLGYDDALDEVLAADGAEAR